MLHLHTPEEAARIKEGIASRIATGSLDELGVFLCKTFGHELDPYTEQHQIHVADLSVAIGLKLGLSATVLEGLRVSARVHDIGKFALPTAILVKPEPLSDAEIEVVREHVEMGHEVLQNIALKWPVADIVLQHHERLNGSGYPSGLHADEILIEAKIIAVADTVEAMTCERSYKKPAGLDAALQNIADGRGTLFDTDVVNACLDLFCNHHYAFTYPCKHLPSKRYK
jgi:HD-GYP domain-containing protein (c-di-GMP phosphodiesterase class II)